MSFVSAKFESTLSVDEFRSLLEQVPNIRVLGDWHEIRLANVTEAGLPLSSAPGRTIINNLEQQGPAIMIEVLLANGSILSGKFRKSALLISNKEVSVDEVRSDEFVTRLIDAIQSVATVTATEFG